MHPSEIIMNTCCIYVEITICFNTLHQFHFNCLLGCQEYNGGRKVTSSLCFQVELSFILSQAEATLSSLVQRGQELASRLRALQVDRRELACLKFLLLFNPSEFASYLHFYHLDLCVASSDGVNGD